MKDSNIPDEVMYLQYIRLFQMQLLGVLEDMEKPAESLSNVFSDVLMAVIDLKNDVSINNTLSNKEILTVLEDVIMQMQECIVGFQFFDAKRQRLENVSDGMDTLAKYIRDNKSDSHIQDTNALRKKVIGLYKMEREHSIYRNFLQEKNIFDPSFNITNK